METSQYFDVFIDESKEHLQKMNEILLILEKNPEDTQHLNELFRIAHTLKGMSGTMGFNHVLQLTHEMENLMDQVRKNITNIDESVVNLLFDCLDQLDQYVANIEVDQVEGENISNDLIKEIKRKVDGSSNLPDDINNEPESTLEGASQSNIKIDEYVKDMIKKAEEDNFNIFKLKICLDEKCMLKSARAYIVFSTLEQDGEIIHSEPSIEDIEDERFDLCFELVIITKHSEESIRNNLNNISELNTVELEQLSFESILALDSNEEALSDSSTVTIETEKVTPSENAKDVSDQPKKARAGKTVRVDIDRLDNLMNLVSELIIIKTRLDDAHQMTQEKSISDTTEQLERITTSLHDAVMKVRMVPIERVFNRFPRMVRDLSKELGKEIDLIMTGEDTEVDRTVIDEIGDPLIHLIRNAMDHGIEEPDVRIKSHKNKTGKLKLTAFPDGNNVVIEVEDDGKGVDIEKVKSKAIANGLISESQSQLMESKELIQLLFHPGFSTADKVSDLSGRGVGLDVVQTKIENLGGEVEIDSKPGIGSRFTIRLPLTLAIIQALLVDVESEKYAIPLNNIREISTIEEGQIRNVQGKEVVLFRQSTLPIIRLSEILKVPAVENKEVTDEYTIVIVSHGDRTFGLIVDNLIGQQEIVIKSLGKYLSTVKGIAGATILGNGTVALIVDTNSLF
ncbi:two-component system, chemotaxis family, sensor kinase CheA [Tindallia magadiensis]|uniref:Chemotaxis protein CheA n=1 Tax=Tindallia magadiensis TaxID=69895 RepID=A0A1I3AIE3_9FIRM|nr:chemotaxis protein CheA [Tindallia magadiensis]SFH49773.1 two-component system, chemotaxis family, sensor kinase CheA [Tindallia magadiensis]